MFFSRPDEILALSRLSGITIFSFPSDFDYTDFIPKNILQITPQEKSTISIEEIRQLDSLVHSRQDNELFIIVHPAESLTEAAMNACLKTIESPQSNVHFIFFSKHQSAILQMPSNGIKFPAGLSGFINNKAFIGNKVKYEIKSSAV